MPKISTVFICSACGFESAKWQGKCSSCLAWNSFKETDVETKKGGLGKEITTKETVALKGASQNFTRLKTGISEFDRVLGGGLTKSSFVLLGGEPGIGKSTLALQVTIHLGLRQNVLYVSAEESLEQVAMRAERLGIHDSKIKFLSDRNLESILASVAKEKPSVLVIDSIQTISSLDLPGIAGSVSQVRSCTEILMEAAKEKGFCIILIGHITKDGNLAGPKTMEHLVDTVLYLEGDQKGEHRLLRASKNRFGSVNEIGVFEMTEKGLLEISDAAATFISNSKKLSAGSCITAVLEGTRSFLLEVQALTTVTNFGYPKRLATGFSLNRLQLIIAVLTRQAGCKLDNKDVYLKVSGGFDLSDPVADLAVALAIVSSLKSKPLNWDMIAVGELSLSGEIRKTSKLEGRLKEAKRLGYKALISANKDGLEKVVTAQNIKELLAKLF